MRTLNSIEVNLVSGGNTAADSALAACKGMPDSAKITVSIEAGGSIGGPPIGSVDAKRIITIETTCGEVRKEAEKSKAGSGTKKSSFMGYDTDSHSFSFSGVSDQGYLVLEAQSFG